MNKNKKFSLLIIIFPIILVIISISVITLYNINTLKSHGEQKILEIKEDYISNQKNIIFNKVKFLDNAIKFQQKQVEKKLKESLKDKINIALNFAQYIYDKEKGKISDQKIKQKIAQYLSSLDFYEDRGYYFTYENDTNIILGHRIKKFIGKDMTNFKDKHNKILVNLYKDELKVKKIAFAKLYFNKPNDTKIQYPKLVCITKFKPLNLIIGTGEYLDEIEKKIQNYVIERFSNTALDSNYLFIYKLHKINGGDNFATMILNQNRPDLIGKNISDNYLDAKGKKFRKEFLEKIRKHGHGYVKYWYKKPNEKKAYPKMSYFYLQKDWNWIIANGFYFDDLTKDIQKINSDIQKDVNKTIKSSILVAIVLSIIASIISFLASNRLNTLINRYIHKLQSSEEKLKNAQHIAKIGSWKHSFLDNSLIWSDEVYNIFEVPKDDKIANFTKFLSIIHPDDKAYVSQEYNNSIMSNSSYDIKHRLLFDDNTIKYVREKCDIYFDENNKPLYSLGTVQDITQEVEKQNEIYEKEQLLYQQSKMASMGEMIGNIAHQWRQPLSIISTVATGIQLHLEFDNLDKKQAIKDLSSLEKSVQYLSTTIDDFRNFLNPIDNTITFNIKDIINKNISMFGKSFSSNGIEFILDIEDITVNLNQNELLQVIINILNNSKDALIPKKIDNKYIFISLKQKDDKAILTIKDNGGGIKDEVLPKIFDAYFTTKHKSQGTGLGLYMSYQIITNKFNGNMSVITSNYVYNDTRYTGAEFKIELPIKVD